MTDMRAPRTRSYLRDALLELLDAKSLDRCTVTEVCNLAQVSRKAFYAHYGTLEELAQDCYLCWNVYAGPQGKRLGDYGSLEEACLETLDQMARKMSFFKAHPNLARAVMLNVEVSPYFELAEKTETDLNLDHIMTMYGGTTVPFAQAIDVAHYITSGTLGLTRRWVLDGMRQDIETIVKAAAYLSFQCAAGSIGRHIEPVYAQTLAEWHFDGDAGAESN